MTGSGRLQPSGCSEVEWRLLTQNGRSPAKPRISEMDVGYVEETDLLRQALLEIYMHVVLRTPYNDFAAH